MKKIVSVPVCVAVFLGAWMSVAESRREDQTVDGCFAFGAAQNCSSRR